MIGAIQGFLLFYCLTDITLQIMVQMPFLQIPPIMNSIGFRKIWKNPNRNRPERVFDYGEYINSYGDTDHGRRTLYIDPFNLALQCLNCVIICTIML